MGQPAQVRIIPSAILSLISIAVFFSPPVQAEVPPAYDQTAILSSSPCGQAISAEPDLQKDLISACEAALLVPSEFERDLHLRSITIMGGEPLSRETIEALSNKLPQSDATRLMAGSFFKYVDLPLEDFLKKYDPLIEQLTASRNQFDLIFLRYRVGVFASLRGDMARAQKEMAWVVETAPAWGYPGLLHSALNLQALQAVQTNEIEQGIRLYEEAIAASRAADADDFTAVYMMSLGTAFFELRDFDTAEKMYEEAHEILIGMEPYQSEKLFWVFENIGLLHAEKEDHERAINYFNDALKAADHSGQTYLMGETRFRLAKSRLAMGKRDIALKEATLALEEILAADPAIAGEVHTWMAQRQLEDDNYDQAMASLSKAQEMIGIDVEALSDIDSLENQNFLTLMNYSQSMAETMEGLGRYREAMAYAKAALAIEHRRAETLQTKTVGDSRLLFKIQEQDQNMKLLETEAALASQNAALQTSKANEARTRLGFLVAIAFALLAAAGLLLRNYYAQRKLAKLRQLFLVETNHRAKNNLQIMTSMLNIERHALEESGIKFPEGNDMSYRAQALALIHEHLYEHNDAMEVKANNFISELLQLLHTGFGNKSISIEENIAAVKLDADQATQIGLLICEAVTNAYKHAFDKKGGTINVTLARAESGLDISVSDNGTGVQRSSDAEHKVKSTRSSIGMELIEGLTEQLHGTLKVISNDQGTQLQFLNVGSPAAR